MGVNVNGRYVKTNILTQEILAVVQRSARLPSVSVAPSVWTSRSFSLLPRGYPYQLCGGLVFAFWKCLANAEPRLIPNGNSATSWLSLLPIPAFILPPPFSTNRSIS